MKKLVLLTTFFSVICMAGFVPTKDSVSQALKRNADAIRKNPAKLAKFMSAKSSQQYLAYLKTHKIQELPKMDVLPSGVYFPEGNLRLEYVETQLKTGVMIWKINGKEIKWYSHADFNTHLKVFETALKSQVSWFDWILPSAHAMAMPTSLKKLAIENVITTGWFGGIDYATVHDASKYVCETLERQSAAALEARTATELLEEIQFLAYLQKRYKDEMNSCATRVEVIDCTPEERDSGVTGIATCTLRQNSEARARRNAGEECDAYRAMQECLNKMTKARLSLMKKDVLYSDIPTECVFAKQGDLEVLNPLMETLDGSAANELSDSVGRDRANSRPLAKIVQTRCYGGGDVRYVPSQGSK